MHTDCDVLVVGGGFYGCMIAAYLRQRYARVLLLEAGNQLLCRASYANQARVHQGYHYPRSLVTGFRSRANYERFRQHFPECLFTDFQHVYAIGREFSKVSAAQFELFCRRIGAPFQPAPGELARWFRSSSIEAVYLVEEVAFDACKLRQRMQQTLTTAGVDISLNTRAIRLNSLADGSLRVVVENAAGSQEIIAGQVFNCTYSNLNQLALASGLPTVALKQELAEMALVQVPSGWESLAVTVMCGPFFSLMPFPARGLHTLSHVRYTPHASWPDPHPDGITSEAIAAQFERVSAFERMRRDAARYVTAIADCDYRDSLWEIKTLLPANEVDDGRPILFRAHAGARNYHLVLGAKLDNVFDVFDQIDQLCDGGANAKVA